MGRAPCCEKIGLKRGPWTPEEDQKLVSFINEHGHGSWRALPKKAGLLRCGKSCRLRWTNYLRPDIKRGEFSTSEEHAILQLHALLGNRWSAIASHLPKRTDNEIKNYWNTHLKKRLVKMGLDPVTHKPLSDGVLMSNSSGGTLVVRSSDSEQDKQPELGVDSRGCTAVHCARDRLKTDVKDKDDDTTRVLREVVSATKGSPLTTHLMQWESVRLEAEARLTQEAHMRAKGVWRREFQRSFHSGPATLIKMVDSLSTPTEKQRSVGALKAVSAVEIINALHNWEKSLQGQAGALWPDSWKLAAAGANNNQFSSCGHSESSSSSSPLAADRTLSASASAPSSTTSVEPRKLSGSERGVAASSPGQPRSPPRKLSWNDAPRPPPACFKGPDALPLDSGIGSRPCGSFSSLMLDAVLGRSLVQAPRMVPLIASHLKDTIDKGNSDVQLEGESADADKDFNPIEASIDVSAVTGDVQEVGERACTVEDAHVEDDDEMSADGTSDLFKDLPRLKKRDVTTAPVSYTAMLSEEISDYWSNMVLKEQVSSPTSHMAF